MSPSPILFSPIVSHFNAIIALSAAKRMMFAWAGFVGPFDDVLQCGAASLVAVSGVEVKNGLLNARKICSHLIKCHNI